MMILLLLLALGSDSTRRVAVAPHESLTVTVTRPASPPSSDAGPAIVFIPGLLGGSFGFRKVTTQLAAAGHATYVVEPLGTGTSSHPRDGDYSLDAQSDRIAAVLDSLGVTGAVVVGANFGASVALRMAYRHPERVAAVLSLDGGPVDRSSTGGATTAMRLAPILKFFGARGIARRRIGDALRDYSADSTWVTAEVVDAYSKPIANDLGGAAAVLSDMRRAAVPEPLGDNLWRIHQPVRLLIGASNRQGGIESGETALLRERLPNFAVDSVFGSGSYLHEERPEVVVAAVLALADSVLRLPAVSDATMIP
ncbi:MAG: alpha/beta fold hydrolase [Gemmatimonadales bacterium]